MARISRRSGASIWCRRRSGSRPGRMKDARVGLLLTVAIMVMAAAPLFTAFYLLEDAMRTSLNLGFNPQVVGALEQTSDNLRTLNRLDPANSARYREQFDQVQELKQIYSDPEFVKQRILGSMKLYLGLGLGVAVLLSVALRSEEHTSELQSQSNLV